jgi:hypothetical protein
MKRQLKAEDAQRQLKCSLCDGTGLVCDICGEPERARECDVGVRTFSACENCAGTGDYGTGKERS